jgi:hypothetical protein
LHIYVETIFGGSEREKAVRMECRKQERRGGERREEGVDRKERKK